MFRGLKNSIASIPIGLLLLVASFPLLFWNEGRAVKTARALAEGAKKVVMIDAGIVNPDYEGLLVHLSGDTRSNETLRDSSFAVASNAIKLRRNVEMYQWQEKSESGNKNKSDKEYSYSKVWSDELISSSGFHNSGYDNPSSFPFEQISQQATDVNLGAYKLSPSLISKMNNYSSLVLNANNIQNLQHNPSFGNRFVNLQGNQIYLSYTQDQTFSQVGDIRVGFEQVLAGPVSVIAEQHGNSFVAFKAKSGKELEMLRTGSHTASEMFEMATKENNFLTWGMRFLGFFLMVGAFRLILGPIEAMTSMIPLLGGMVRAGLSLVSFSLAFALTLITVAISWFTFRPLIAIPLLVLALVGVTLVWLKGRNKEVIYVSENVGI